MTILLLYPLFHVTCGVLAYGITFAYHQRWQNHWPSDNYVRDDAAIALAFGLIGPLGLGVSFLLSGFAKHGLLYRPSKR